MANPESVLGSLNGSGSPGKRPEPPTLGPLDFQTVLLLSQVFEVLKARGLEGKVGSVDEFELASRFGLESALRRHSPGKPVNGAGASPIFDWIFCSTPYRSQAKEALEQLLFLWSRPNSETYVRNLLTPLILWTMDLPASESSHHAYPYGLLDHSLEVMLASTKACADKFEDAHYGGDMSARDCGHALRLTSILSGHHDIGKVFGVEVKDEKSGEIWDPAREPLAYFKARHEMPILDATPFRFVKGRGLNSHEDRGRKLLPIVLHPRIRVRMGPDAAKAYDAYVDRYETPAIARPAPIDFIADQVHRADQSSAARSCAKGAKPGEHLLELAAKVPILA
jgi:hypothetical protein